MIERIFIVVCLLSGCRASRCAPARTRDDIRAATPQEKARNARACQFPIILGEEAKAHVGEALVAAGLAAGRERVVAIEDAEESDTKRLLWSSLRGLSTTGTE
jgi:hypothetical protein